MYRQIQEGQEVHLLTLTRGGATKQRFKYGYSKAEMGEVRLKEMEEVNKVLNLTSMEVLDLPDGELHKMNPLDLEGIVLDRLNKIQPDIVVTYSVHGISGHHDHLTIHPVVKRLYSALQRNDYYDFLRRLAFFTLPAPEGSERAGGNANVRRTPRKDIGCILHLNEEEQNILKRSLYCYETFIDVIEETGVIEEIGDKVHFEFFEEQHDPVLSSLTAGL